MRTAERCSVDSKRNYTRRAVSGLIALMLTLTAMGCTRKLDRAFSVTYVTYGREGGSVGHLVTLQHTAQGEWQTVSELELPREAVLLFPPPYPESTLQYLTILEGYPSKAFSLWEVRPNIGTRFVFTRSARVAVLWANSPSASMAAVVFVHDNHANLRSAEYGRQSVSLTANFCSLAVIRYADQESMEVVGSSDYARPGWLDDQHIIYISRSGYLINYDVLAQSFDTVAAGVEAVSTAPLTARMAIAFKGDSLRVLGATAGPNEPAMQGAAVPSLSPDGSWLAYHSSDHGLWARELATGEESELGIGYAVNWSDDGQLLLHFERKLDDQNVARTIFHVTDVRTGAGTTVPQDGFQVDAVLLP